MKILYTKTGSTGNCSVIQGENGGLLIVDTGIKFDKVNREVGYQLHRVEACLITHAHADHFACIKDFLSAGINTYLLPETRSQVPKIASNRYLREVLVGDNGYKTDSFVFRAVEMVHTNADGTSCPCVGWLILDRISGVKMLWATDTQYIHNRFPALDYYCIEANFFEVDDYEQELPYIVGSVEERRVRSHFSVEAAGEFLKQQDLSKCKAVYLLHLSHSMDKKERNKVVRHIKKIVGKNIKVYGG